MEFHIVTLLQTRAKVIEKIKRSLRRAMPEIAKECHFIIFQTFKPILVKIIYLWQYLVLAS
jgi:hypothetical protein